MSGRWDQDRKASPLCARLSEISTILSISRFREIVATRGLTVESVAPTQAQILQVAADSLGVGMARA